jgi:hypothetical protein
MLRNLTTKVHLLLAVTIGSLLLTSCEDPIPADYVEELVIEGFTLVGEPLTNIRVMRTLPIGSDTFSFNKASLPDAIVRVTAAGKDIPIVYVPDTLGGTFQAVDTSYRVLPSTSYTIRVEALGKVLEATTTTPKAISWTRLGPSIIQFPHPDSLLFPGADSLNVSWSPVPNIEDYVIGLTCLDTLNYGKYLAVPTTDSNTRTPRPRPDFFNREGTLVSNERTFYGASFGFSSSPIIWGAFRWHGLHELKIYAPNREFLEWFYQVGSGRRSTYDYRLSNIKGGLGVWGGASVVKTQMFLLKHKG